MFPRNLWRNRDLAPLNSLAHLDVEAGSPPLSLSLFLCCSRGRSRWVVEIVCGDSISRKSIPGNRRRGGGRTLGACLPTEGGGGRGEGRKEEERWKESPVTCTASRDVRSVGRVLDGACPRLLISSSSVARRCQDSREIPVLVSRLF